VAKRKNKIDIKQNKEFFVTSCYLRIYKKIKKIIEEKNDSRYIERERKE